MGLLSLVYWKYQLAKLFCFFIGQWIINNCSYWVKFGGNGEGASFISRLIQYSCFKGLKERCHFFYPYNTYFTVEMALASKSSPMKNLSNLPVLSSPSKRSKSSHSSEGCTAVTQKEKQVLRFAKLTSNAITPSKGSKLAAGYDLYR